MNLYRYTLSLIIACLFSANLFAGNEHSLYLDTTYQVGNKNQYRSLKVIDVRADKSDIGHLKTGAFNRNADITTDKPLEAVLSAHFNVITKNHKGSGELVLVLYQFYIEDRANGGEIGTFYFDGDFYGNNNGQYTFLGKTDSLYEVTSSMDVTHALTRMVQEQVNQVLDNYAKLDIKTLDAPVYTEAQLAERRKQQKLSYPIYQAADNFKKGIYYTREQFINNTPVDTPFIESIYHQATGRKEIVVLYYPNTKGKRGKEIKAETYFAAYDGKDWVLSIGQIGISMQYKDGEFYATVPLQGIKDKGDAVAGGMLLGGIVGGAIAGAATQGKGWGIYKAKFDPATKDFRPVKRVM